MRTVIADPPPPDFEVWLEQRRRRGADRHDVQGDFRVPDRGLHRPDDAADWCDTAALVVEILSPGDETPEKLPFYAAHRVDEVVIVDADTRSVRWLALENEQYRPVARSRLIDLGAEELRDQISWP